MEKISNIIKTKQSSLIQDNIDEDTINKLKQSEIEIENGEGIEAEVAFKQLRQKYGY